MWPKTFDARLDSWNRLRTLAHDADSIESALKLINAWWFDTPWCAYHLHWDDLKDWPDPWQLLSDNIYCDLARGLGIVYTITLMDRDDISDAQLVLTDSGHNLVQVSQSKYILNWDRDTVLNTNQKHLAKKQLTQSQLRQLYY